MQPLRHSTSYGSCPPRLTRVEYSAWLSLAVAVIAFGGSLVLSRSVAQRTRHIDHQFDLRESAIAPETSHNRFGRSVSKLSFSRKVWLTETSLLNMRFGAYETGSKNWYQARKGRPRCAVQPVLDGVAVAAGSGCDSQKRAGGRQLWSTLLPQRMWPSRSPRTVHPRGNARCDLLAAEQMLGQSAGRKWTCNIGSAGVRDFAHSRRQLECSAGAIGSQTPWQGPLELWSVCTPRR